MHVDQEALRRRYAILSTEELVRLASEADQLTAEARRTLEEELSRRRHDRYQDADDQAYELAIHEIGRGVPVSDVERRLTERGIDAVTAARVAQSVQEERRAAERRAAKNTVAFGIAWFAGGGAVTAISYQGALNRGGGYYVAAWGAMLYGVIQLIRGLNRLLSSNTSLQPTGDAGG